MHTYSLYYLGERRYHATIPFVLATVALAFMAAEIDENPTAAFIAMLVATVLWGPAGIISALPATFLSGPAAATGVALINSIANVGGMLGPFMVGEPLSMHLCTFTITHSKLTAPSQSLT